jgi:cell wall-associated NlpC family hydrolase
MSFADEVSRIQEIQSQIVSLSGADATSDPTATGSATGTTSAGGASSVSSANSAVFASTLEASGGQMVTPKSGQMVDNGVTGADVVADAQKYLGVPYVFGGTTSAGLDCSGLVQRVYEDLGIQLPRLVSGQGTIGESVPSLADAQPGDLIVCDGGNHIAIYAGNGMIIQAPKPGGQVEEMKNWITPSNVVTIRRIVPTASDQSGTSGAANATPTATAGTTQAAALASLLTSSAGASSLTGLLGSSSGSTLAALLGSSGDSAALTALLGSSGTGSSLASLLGSSGESSALLGLLGGASGSSGSLLAELASVSGLAGATGSAGSAGGDSLDAGTIASIIGDSIEESALSSILGSSSGQDSSSILGSSSLGSSGASDSLNTQSLLFSLLSGGLT